MYAQVATQVVKEMKGQPFTLLVLFTIVVFSSWSFVNHARASDITAIKIAAEENSGKIDRILRLQLAEAIRTVQRQYCIAQTASEKQQLQRTIDGLQDDYHEIALEYYATGGCSE